MASFLEEYNEAVERDGPLPPARPEDNVEKFEEGADATLDGWLPEE